MPKLLSASALLVGVTWLAGCASATENKALNEIANFYGGRVEINKGFSVDTRDDGLKGKYFEVVLQHSGISRDFDNLSMPASNCAYLVYHNFTPDERLHYDYFKVEIDDSTSVYHYTFSTAEVARGSRACQLAGTLLTNLQHHNYLSAANTCNPLAFASTSSDSLLSFFSRTPHYLVPFESFVFQGFETQPEKLGGQRLQLTNLFVTVPNRQLPTHLLTFLVNPQLKPTERFLYGFRLIR